MLYLISLYVQVAVRNDFGLKLKKMLTKLKYLEPVKKIKPSV